jgi:hypothetical protein
VFGEQMSAVGIAGSAVERGLLAAYLALTNPANVSTPDEERFIRPAASLYVVVVSDEDDSSCHPLLQQTVCTADPGCRCAPDSILGGTGSYGATDFFVRFLETFKGYGQGERVALAAIVALDGATGVPAQFGDLSQHVGCCRTSTGEPCPTSGINGFSQGYDIAYHGARYLEVSSQTGGVAVDICQDDFSAALSSLGYAASGLRREFRLTRGPELEVAGGIATGIALYVSSPSAGNCTTDGNCQTAQGEVCRSGRCAKRVPVRTTAAADSAQYVRCDASNFRNILRFDGTAVPEPLSAIEICYDVAPNFQTTCL